MSKLTEKEFLDLQVLMEDNYNTGHLRKGQAYMNALYGINPKLYNSITNTNNDCFYNDDIIDNFFKYLNDV